MEIKEDVLETLEKIDLKNLDLDNVVARLGVNGECILSSGEDLLILEDYEVNDFLGLLRESLEKVTDTDDISMIEDVCEKIEALDNV